MIQIFGIIMVLIFYVAYFSKLINQKSRGIKTNQLGRGRKTKQNIVIETLLRIATILIVIVMLGSAILNTTLFTSNLLRAIGLGLLFLGTCIFIIAMVTMKDNWRAGITHEDKTSIVTNGIYMFSRNPAFLGFDLTYIGACLAFGNIILIVITVITIILMHMQILQEEKFLESTFQQEYRAYKSKVRRYL